MLDSRVERIARDVDFLIDEGEIPQVTRIALDPPSTVEASEDAAAMLRGQFDVPQGPLLDLQAFAERAGLLSFSLDLGKKGGDAAYVAVGDLGVAVINGALEPRAMPLQSRSRSRSSCVSRRVRTRGRTLAAG